MDNSLQLVFDGELFSPFVQLFLFVFGTIGLTHILVDSTLFRPVREMLKGLLHEKLYNVFECYQCCGTWCGFLVGIMTISSNPLTLFVCGCAGSFLASWAAFYLNYLEAKTMLTMENKDPDGE